MTPRNLRSARLFTSCVCAFFVVGAVALAQEYRGRVQGLVTDPSQAVVVGATVTLANVDTGVTTVKQTGATGDYRFDFVQPGAYSVAVEASGFDRFIQRNVTVLTRGDVTVNAQLTVKGAVESVTVSGTVSAVQFNTSTVATTVGGVLLRELPSAGRNPFTLAIANPAVFWGRQGRGTTSLDVGPELMWEHNDFNVGGPTAGKNDLLVDGAPTRISARGSYVPSMDAVQEFTVEQNSMDAEFGFSAGGVLSITMKSGTNQFHGSLYYLGRNPAMNAMSDRVRRNPTTARYHTWGGILGGPIVKNRIFFSNPIEMYRQSWPSSALNTVPTALERAGDFSQTLTPTGVLRVIYDPFTTQFDPATNKVTRQPFAQNRITPDRFDPTAVRVLNDLWKPNRPPENVSGVNNFYLPWAYTTNYWNWSNRADFNISDKLRMFTRYSRYVTRQKAPMWGGIASSPNSPDGKVFDGLNASADVVYMIGSRTVLNLRYSATYVEDDYDSTREAAEAWPRLWPNNPWYDPVLKLGELNRIYYPNFSFSGLGSASTGMGGWYWVHGRSHNYQVTLAQDRGIHHLKFGQTLRYSYDKNGSPGTGVFRTSAVDTAATFLSPNLQLSGDPYASLLLGVLTSGQARIRPPLNAHQYQLGAFFQDDIRMSQRITLNLGVRYEYEAAPLEALNKFSRYLDLTQPIPEMLANPPTIPSEVTSLAQIPYKFNGAWVFTDDANRRLHKSPRFTFLPRIGIAIRLNNRSSFRAGFARYAVPLITAHPEGGGFPLQGVRRDTPVEGVLSGVPLTKLSNPFPASNPVLLPIGKSLGLYTVLGDTASWLKQDLKIPVNDRFNFSYQRQLPLGVLADATFFMHFGRDIVLPTMWGGGYNRSVNMVDPNLIYTLKGKVDQTIPNPFYGYLTRDKFPGVLRNRPTIAVRELLRPYPQYMDLTEQFQPGARNRYYAFQLKAERSYTQGLTFTFAYNYNREKSTQWFNDVDQYANRLTWLDQGNPRHRMSFFGTYDLPAGRGRKYLANLHPVLNGVIGGWTMTQVFTWNSGSLIMFGSAIVSGNPKIDNPSRYGWFDTLKLQIIPSYTPRANPWYYDGLRGPRFWNLDSSLSKSFHVTEKIRFELRMEAVNMPNSFLLASPNTTITSPFFGQITSGYNRGRETQFSGRILF